MRNKIISIDGKRGSQIAIGLLFICFFLFTTRCKAQTDKKETWYDLNKTKLNEIFYVKTEPPYLKHGSYKKYNKSSKLIRDYNYSNGEFDGLCINYTDEGTITEKLNYKNGKLHGNYKGYSNSGKLLRDYNYSNGELDGFSINYYDDGVTKKLESYYKNGLLDGETKSYYKSGKLESVFQMKDGKKNGSSTNYYGNGQIKIEANYINDKQDGVVKTYYENGKLESSTPMTAGLRNGKFVNYYNTGNKYQEVDFVNGKQNGYFIEYFDNGKIHKKLPMKNDNTEGTAEMYYDNGNLHAKIPFAANKKSGTATYYDYTNSYKSEVEFVNDNYKNDKDKAFLCSSGNCSANESFSGDVSIISSNWKELFPKQRAEDPHNLEAKGSIKFVRNFTENGQDTFTVVLKIATTLKVGLINSCVFTLKDGKRIKLQISDKSYSDDEIANLLFISKNDSKILMDGILSDNLVKLSFIYNTRSEEFIFPLNAKEMNEIKNVVALIIK